LADPAEQIALLRDGQFRLIDHVRDALLVLDRSDRVTDCNQAAARALGLTRDAIIGAPVQQLLPREVTALLQCPVHLRSEVSTSLAGRERWLEVDVTPIDPPEGRGGRLIITRDISERRHAQQALMDSRRALQAANARLLEQSITDPLTGLRNRRFLFQRLREEASRQRRSGLHLGLLLLDIDHFKRVNDTFGHPAGDAGLVAVARSLQQTIRESDVAARVGGEEFAVMAVDTPLEGLLCLAERLRQAVAGICVPPGAANALSLTVSIGLAVGTGSDDVEALFAAADRGLYRAKRAGRNCVMLDQDA
jgi:diguanylate cyclase (GGDEF)-like protein/PAS domain S-box-containing protein